MIKKIILFILVFVTITAYAENPIICKTRYVLCNAARCEKISSIKKKVVCHCSIWQGNNIGYSSCQQRKRHLTSTFSFGGGHYRYMTCPANIAWVTCLDQPCRVDNHSPNKRRAFCACKLIKNNQPFVTFAGMCETKYCRRAIWSGASMAGNKKLTRLLAAKLGKPDRVISRACRNN